jgi:hypothetical protein
MTVMGSGRGWPTPHVVLGKVRIEREKEIHQILISEIDNTIANILM